MADDVVPEKYAELLSELKERIQRAQIKAAVSVNRELITLYWQIGKDILARQIQENWGAKVVERLAGDLSHEFPDIKGFSVRNLKYMRTLAEAWSDESIVQQLVAQIPWGHNIRLLELVKDAQERQWYITQAIRHGWSRNVLVMQIESDLYRRQGKAITNFENTLPSPQSDLARNLLKDPYNFDFLSLGREALERDVERKLLEKLREFLLELGTGFAFVGSQYHLQVGNEDFYIDLLFFHLQLRCYVAIDLKTGDFKPEYAGKMSFYLSAIDGELRHVDDRPSVGLILCKGRNRVVAEYALKDINKPIGVAEFRTLPEDVRRALPTVEELEKQVLDWGADPTIKGLPADE